MLESVESVSESLWDGQKEVSQSLRARYQGLAAKVHLTKAEPGPCHGY